MSGDAKEIVEEYISSLSELTNNSKPLISMLTILAEDYIEHAPAIVEAVEAHLFKVSCEVKLPVLYLIDSIIKNVNKAYHRLFARNIVNMFCHVFEKGNENTRMCMWKVRTTWNEVFPAKKLYALDLRVQKIDPAWPITSKPPSDTKITRSKSSKHESAVQVATQPTPPVSKVSPVQPTATVTPTVVNPPPVVKLPTLTKPATATEAEMQQELIKKQKLLLELQKQKLDLELMQAKANLEQQRRQLDKQSTLLKPDTVAQSEDDLEVTAPTIASSNSVSSTLEKYPGAASLFKSSENKTGVRISPASSAAVTAVTTARDPRLKLPSTISKESIEELAKQKIMQHLNNLQMQNNASSSLNNDPVVVATVVNNKIIGNNRVDGNQESAATGSNSTAKIASSLLNNNVKESSKNSHSKKSSRKTSNNSRAKTRSLPPSPTKTTSADENSCSPPGKRSKKSSKSRKAHSPSPSTVSSNSSESNSSYCVSKRSTLQDSTDKSPLQTTLDDDEQSLSDSPPYDPAAPITSFKDLRPSTRHRNYIRRNKEGSRSPESGAEDTSKVNNLPDTSKDEDLRAPLGSVNVVIAAASAAAALEKDLDLRVLAMPGGKRPNADASDSQNSKKNKTDRFDALFGSKDVDLRTLTNPNAGRPLTPPQSAISDDKAKDNSGWAKLKTPIKTERDTPRPLQDRNRDKLGRPRFYNKIIGSPEDGKERRFRGPNAMMTTREFDKQNERNIEIIMKQAAEQLHQGEITKSQYNKLIQNVLHMSEDQKLKAAQRKEQEMSMMMWEKGEGTTVQGQIVGNEENIRSNKDLPTHPRAAATAGGPQGAPRWQGGPWPPAWNHPPPGASFPPGAPPPPFPPPTGPMGAPWRMFGPLRPDFSYPPPFNPRLGPPPPLGTSGPMMMPNGPMNPMTMNSMTGGPMSQMPPNMMMVNGSLRSEMQKRLSPSLNGTVPPTSGILTTTSASAGSIGARPMSDNDANAGTISGLGGQVSTGELPPADPALLEEIAKDTMKSINIDSIPREIRYYGNIGIVFMNWDDPRDIGFQDGSRRIFINGKDLIVCNFNEDYKEFTYEGEIHRIKLGTPTRELYVDDKWYECYFGGHSITVDLGNKKISINLEGPIPQVKIGTIRRTDLVIGKINLIINARNMVPVFLDAKPQMFEVEGRPCTLEFTDALQTVLLNGRPFRVEFGGLPKPFIIGEKKQFIRFSVLPRGIRAGHVKITGMKGEQPNVNQAAGVVTSVAAQAANNSSSNNSNQSATTTQASSSSINTTSGLASTPPVNPNVPPGLDLDSTSQDGMDTGSGSKSSDLQLDVLSSIVPSVMAPSSGLSYQAEPAENPQPAVAPAFSLPTNISELFQRLVETGIVPSLDLSKRQEEEEKREPEMILVSFDKPETLRTKQPAMVTALYTGMQCSSCGERFAPEMAAYYSHHLDWHFRQNRKERYSAKKPQSRAWYYDISDWTQFEEIEDLDERTQSWFETEKQNAEAEGTAGEDASADAQQPSVPAGSSPRAVRCEVCHEVFDQYFNEDIEEWHIRPAVTYEGKNYHPICLKDYKEKLLEKTLDNSTTALEETILDTNEGAPKEVIEMEIEIKEEPMDEKPVIKVELIDMMEPIEEISLLQPGEFIKSPKVEEEHIVDEMDDTDLIEIIEPLPRKIEIEDLVDDSSDEIETKENIKVEIEKFKEQRKKLEEKIPPTVPLVFENVRIKLEPIDEPEPAVSVPESTVDTTQVAVKSSIDGNVELESSATSTIPSIPSRIRLNIAKPLNVIPKEEEPKKKEKKVIAKSVSKPPVPPKPLFPATIKPSLQGKKLSILPTVEKGHELSALCSIM